MKRIIVIGCPGSGKTTFSKRLAKKTGITLYHLDAIWHKPDRTHISRDEFDARSAQILCQESWIIDGNYSRTVEARLKCCDTVFLFDLPVSVCLEGAISRLGVKRCDVPFTDTKLDPVFRRQIEDFPTAVLPGIYSLLDKYQNGRQIIVFRSRAEADEFLLK